MIENEPVNVAADPSFVVNEGAVCRNCPFSAVTEYPPLETGAKYLHCCVTGPHDTALGFPMVRSNQWCGQHPYRFRMVGSEEVVEEDVSERSIPKGAMGYSGP